MRLLNHNERWSEAPGEGLNRGFRCFSKLTPLSDSLYNPLMWPARSLFLIGIFSFLVLSCAGTGRSQQRLHPSESGETAPTPLLSSPAVSTPPLLSESPYRDIEKIEPGKIVHLPTGVEVSEKELIDLLAPARIVYVGEVHDNIEDHRVELEILKGLLARFPGKVSVGMEMFRRPAQAQLDQWVLGALDGKDFLKLWYENWGIDEVYYEALLSFIRENKVPLIALNTPQELEVKVGMKGLEGLSEEDQKRLPEIDRMDPYHRKALEAIFKGHGPQPGGLGPFYDVMLLWDEAMAETIARYLTSPEGSDKKMVVFAGGFHVGYGFGIPRRVFRRLPTPYQIVLPYTRDVPEDKKGFMADVTSPYLPLMLADFVWGVGYREAPDKKGRLGVQIEPFQAGIRVASVSPNSSAADAGLQPGDIVVSFDGETLQEPFDLTYAVRQKSPGDRVKMELIRDGKQIETEVTLKPSGHP
ncbi:MAG TPA: ChaN family lipoprotein [Candidatus Manganitrophaceae bacterium]|nr:ChaN family lipoprotein [Candidatus Manganitrophaceae bacterium]